MDLDATGLQNVAASQDNPETVANELLNYFRNRSTVKHPINYIENEEITEKEFKWANDALKHIFVGQPAYPSHFCGEDIDWNSRPVPDNEWVWQLNRMYFWNAMGKIYCKNR